MEQRLGPVLGMVADCHVLTERYQNLGKGSLRHVVTALCHPGGIGGAELYASRGDGRIEGVFPA